LQVADIHHTLSPVGGHTVSIVIFSPDGAHVQSGSNDRTIKLWDAATGAPIRIFEGHSSSRIGRIFPDGARALSGSFDQTLKLWDTATRALIRTIEGESQGVTSVAFLLDCARVLSGSDDKALELWDATTGALTLTLERDDFSRRGRGNQKVHLTEFAGCATLRAASAITHHCTSLGSKKDIELGTRNPRRTVMPQIRR